MPQGNPEAYFSPDAMALMEAGDVASLPPEVAQLVLRERLKSEALRRRAAAQQPQAPAPMDDLAMLAQMSPERRAENAAMGTLDEEGQLLAGQLADAQALQSRPMAQRETLGGAIGSGLASVLDSVTGGIQARNLRAKQEALLRRKDKGRADYQDDVVRFRALQQQRVAPTAGMADVSLLPPGMG